MLVPAATASTLFGDRTRLNQAVAKGALQAEGMIRWRRRPLRIIDTKYLAIYLLRGKHRRLPVLPAYYEALAAELDRLFLALSERLDDPALRHCVENQGEVRRALSL